MIIIFFAEIKSLLKSLDKKGDFSGYVVCPVDISNA